ncbi:glycine/betaine ABC transporter substrate-binding protein [Pseudoduganella sp. FT55W]|uniref:Glycine/betaine ABC transporter substrate-binding protein n=1 Tax=Duganella rivi TaxID=2666083 RepID=A0A7X4KCE7_9BURK|nr:glycine betaine ABC transporter substrate-binding protein [Duganella rivi]MYM67283.1 glycine/betaine ABC transporter substrate-binding protein [Duganella rivi]
MNPDIQSRRRALLFAAAGMAVPLPATVLASDKRPIVLGQVSLSFYAVTGAVIQEVLARLGHDVTVRSGPHEEMFPLLASGAIDLMAAAWLPEGHAAYWKQYGTGAHVVTKLYDGAHFFWAVPDYVPANELASIADLAKPGVVARIDRQIQGIGAGAAISTLSQRALADYGLDALGYSFRPGSAAEWIATYQAAKQERRWMIFPTWAPQFLNKDGGLRPLADPKGVLGSMNYAALVAPQGKWQMLPDRTRAVLSKVHLGIQAVTEMDYLVNVDKLTASEAARRWIQRNANQVDSWFA